MTNAYRKQLRPAMIINFEVFEESTETITNELAQLMNQLGFESQH
jgi:hypothetical protein